MTEKEQSQWENVAYRMDAEGFHYCFASYSSFPEIQDPEFHRLREDYLRAAELLEKYITEKTADLPEEDED
jgi:hypothetical protein